MIAMTCCIFHVWQSQALLLPLFAWVVSCQKACQLLSSASGEFSGPSFGLNPLTGECLQPQSLHKPARLGAERDVEQPTLTVLPLESMCSRPLPGIPDFRFWASVTHLYCTLQTLSTSGTRRLNSSKQPQDPAKHCKGVSPCCARLAI